MGKLWCSLGFHDWLEAIRGKKRRGFGKTEAEQNEMVEVPIYVCARCGTVSEPYLRLK